MKKARIVVVAAANEDETSTLFDFCDALVGSQWLRNAGGEYGVAASQCLHVNGPAITADLDYAAMREYVAAAVAGVAPPDGNTIYLLYLPRGRSAIVDGVSNAGCAVWVGAHTTLDAGGDVLAWGQRCSPAMPDVGGLEGVGSHVVFESLTDPVWGEGWVLARDLARPPWTTTPWRAAFDGDGLAELCNDRARISEGGFQYVRTWSNAASLAGGDPCVPGDGGDYFATTVPGDWIVLQAGATVDVPILGRATSMRADWLISATLRASGTAPASTSSTTGGDGGTSSDGGASSGSDGTAPFAFTLPNATIPDAGGPAYAPINTTKPESLHVTAAATARSGSWALITIASVDPSTLSQTSPTSPSPPVHRSIVGVYIP